MDINDEKPEDVLKPKFIQQYKDLHNDIWHRLIQVHTNIIILERIEKFPFERFSSMVLLLTKENKNIHCYASKIDCWKTGSMSLRKKDIAIN